MPRPASAVRPIEISTRRFVDPADRFAWLCGRRRGDLSRDERCTEPVAGAPVIAGVWIRRTQPVLAVGAIRRRATGRSFEQLSLTLLGALRRSQCRLPEQ